MKTNPLKANPRAGREDRMKRKPDQSSKASIKREARTYVVALLTSTEADSFEAEHSEADTELVLDEVRSIALMLEKRWGLK